MITDHTSFQEPRAGGHLRFLNHNSKPLEIEGVTHLQKVLAYLARNADFYKLNKQDLAHLPLHLDGRKPTEEGASFRLETQKIVMDTITYVFVQTYFGLPVWESGLAVTIEKESQRVLSSSSSAYEHIRVVNGSTRTRYVEKTQPAAVHSLMGIPLTAAPAKGDVVPAAGPFAKEEQKIKVTGERFLIYRYEAKKRTVGPVPSREKYARGLQGDEDPFVLPLPEVPKSIEEGAFYVVREILFTQPIQGIGLVTWRAFVEPETGAVLYLRAFGSNVTAMVFQTDPITKGNSAATPSTGNAVLNPLRDSVVLNNLNPPAAGVQSLSGSLVRLQEVENPVITAPTASPPYSFVFDSRTNDFAAVNSYYHCDAFFQLLLDMGFGSSYLNGTALPIPVDHRGFPGATGTGITVNAHCLGNTTGITSVDFALADTTDTANPLGIACDRRVVLHEIGGHGVLYCHVGTANFGFAHSAGDSVAVILNDPGTQAADRFATFPWVNIARRHNRTPAAGWGWAGSIALSPFDWGLDYGGYNNEQILSTTLFRLYLSMGGGSTDINLQRFAARFSVYLIMRAIGTLSSTTNPATALGFEQALETADAGNWTSVSPAETHAGGAYVKTIRWAFEQQGMFQQPGTPTPNNNAGAPPPVDVYINDGRDGNYGFQPNHWSCQDIWNRTGPGDDGGGVHQEPIVGQPNYAWVRIKNRGYQAATGIVVKAFHCLPGVGLTYPNDWIAMTTPQLTAPDLPANDSVGQVVGPFEWTPSQVGHECMFFSVSASDDPSNIDGRVLGPIPEWRLVPHDNNIGQRNVAPVASSLDGLVESFAGRPFWIRNNFDREVKVDIDVNLPAALAERGWRLTFTGEGGNSFFMKPGERKQVRMLMKPGKDLDLKKQAAHAPVEVVVRQDGIVVGGMNYYIDPHMDRPGETYETKGTGSTPTGRDLIELAVKGKRTIKSASVRKMLIEIDFEDDDCG
ncbi:MAG: hypothetical protein QM820_26555 [Minicystis sp.]